MHTHHKNSYKHRIDYILHPWLLISYFCLQKVNLKKFCSAHCHASYLQNMIRYFIVSCHKDPKADVSLVFLLFGFLYELL